MTYMSISDKRNKKMLEEQEVMALSGENIAVIEETEIGLSNLEITNDLDTLEDYPERVMITNLSVLANTSIPTAAIYSLQEYLTMYLDYYLETNTTYEGTIIEDTVKDSNISPSFHVYIEEIELDIECLFHPTRKLYYLYSRLNPK